MWRDCGDWDGVLESIVAMCGRIWTTLLQIAETWPEERLIVIAFGRLQPLRDVRALDVGRLEWSVVLTLMASVLICS